MKILTGSLRGRTIRLAPNGNLRPTSDLVRKSVFDALQGAFEAKTALDLFSGTGAFGLEALSLGAKRVLWVDSDDVQVETLEKTIEDLGLEDSGQVICSDVFRAIENLGRQGQVFDFIFLDPPYHQGLGQKAVKLILESSLVDSGSIIVLETHKTEDPPETVGRLRSVKTKKHGDTKITFYAAV